MQFTISHDGIQFSGNQPRPATYPFIITDSAVSFVVDGKSYQASKANPLFGDIVSKLKAGIEPTSLIPLMNIANEIDRISNGMIQNQGGVLVYQDEELNDTVSNWLVKNLDRKDAAVNAVINFLARVNLNPSPGSVDMLWRFIRKNGLVLMPNGYFIGYRYVNDELRDCHTNTFDNSPGRVCEMPREDVTYDPNQYCSPGLHVGAWEHVSGKRNVIEVIVDPARVVSVPNGEDWKMRVCRFESWKLLRHKDVDMAERSPDFVDLN